ncbi:MAG: 30S ribosomal protein S2, partial [Chitinophagia bacterium]|nr:30S ribosomal protein S2 [Chitinophagia bacterium]
LAEAEAEGGRGAGRRGAGGTRRRTSAGSASRGPGGARR